jgi:UDP-3-O-[3-hydroxymyristoyl] glucosamine N-acyltransferase
MKKQTEIASLADLANITGGQVDGNPDILISGVCSLDNPRSGCIAMALEGVNFSWTPDQERPSALIVANKIPGINLPLILHRNPRLAFTVVLRHLYDEIVHEPGIHPTAVVDPSAVIAKTAWIGPFVVVESDAHIDAGVQIWPGCFIGKNSRIGSETRIYPNVVVMHDVGIGARCIIQPGVVIGSDGFGFTPAADGNLKVPQIGTVTIGDDVEIGANTTIDRATLDATEIADDVKIDNLVQVAHNVKIGTHTRIAAQVGLAGHVRIGANVVIGGQAGFKDGTSAGENTMIAARAGVIGDIPPRSRVSGFPARDHRKELRVLAVRNRLPEILDRLEELERRICEKADKS